MLKTGKTKNFSCSSSSEESDYFPDECFISFSEEGELEIQKNKSKSESEIDENTPKKRKVLKKRGRKRNSLRRSFTLLEGDELYFNGFNPDFIICGKKKKKI